MTPSNAELKNELTQLLDTIYGRDSAPTADKILVLFQAREQQLITELLGEAVKYELWEGSFVKAVPVAVIQSKIEELNG